MLDTDAHDDDLPMWQSVGMTAWRLIGAERAKRLGRVTPFGPAQLVTIEDLRAARLLQEDWRNAREEKDRDRPAAKVEPAAASRPWGG